MSAGASVPHRRQQATAARSEKKLPTDGSMSNKKKEGVSESSSSDAGELPGADRDSSSAAPTSEESTDAEGLGEAFAWSDLLLLGKKRGAPFVGRVLG